MEKIVHKADSRGRTSTDWLESRHTFCFNEYFDSNRINFGALRVINDDKVAPGKGFKTHPHKNMEIVSIPLKGELRHGDSRKNDCIIGVGDMQVMSAGTGIFHSELNNNKSEPLEFLQIWIVPRDRNTEPIYNDFHIDEIERRNELSLIISPNGDAPGTLLQDTWFSVGKIECGQRLSYKMHQIHTGVYIFLIEGEIQVAGEVLSSRDGIGIYKTHSIEIKVLKDSHILLIEVPM